MVDRQIDRQDRWSERQKAQTDGQDIQDRQTHEQADRQTCGQTDGQIGQTGQLDKSHSWDRQTHGTDDQMDRYLDRQTEIQYVAASKKEIIRFVFLKFKKNIKRNSSCDL